MDIPEYVRLVANRIQTEQERGNWPEIIRLMRLLSETLIEKATEIEILRQRELKKR